MIVQAVPYVEIEAVQLHLNNSAKFRKKLLHSHQKPSENVLATVMFASYRWWHITDVLKRSRMSVTKIAETVTKFSAYFVLNIRHQHRCKLCSKSYASERYCPVSNSSTTFFDGQTLIHSITRCRYSQTGFVQNQTTFFIKTTFMYSVRFWQVERVKMPWNNTGYWMTEPPVLGRVKILFSKHNLWCIY